MELKQQQQQQNLKKKKTNIYVQKLNESNVFVVEQDAAI